MEVEILDVNISRNAQILTQFKQILNDHFDDIMAGRTEKMYEIREIADIIGIHPVYLSKVIKIETGQHACYFYEQRILVEAKKLLAGTSLPIGEIARTLDYDVSNFSKFFKRFTGTTPSLYRKSLVSCAE